MISPNFENCQIGVDYATGQILDLSESARVGLVPQMLIEFKRITYLHASILERVATKRSFHCAFSTFLPIDSSSFGLCKYCSLQR